MLDILLAVLRLLSIIVFQDSWGQMLLFNFMDKTKPKQKP